MQRWALRNLFVGVVMVLAALIAPVASHASPAERDGHSGVALTVSPMAYEDCVQWRFCGWDGLDATGYGFAIGGNFNCGDYINLWDLPFPTGGSWRDHIDSIKNTSSGTWQLRDYVNGQSVLRWTSVAGNWGNLPPEARNNVDRLIFVC